MSVHTLRCEISRLVRSTTRRSSEGGTRSTKPLALARHYRRRADSISPNPLFSAPGRHAAFASMAAGSAPPACIAKHVTLTRHWSDYLLSTGNWSSSKPRATPYWLRSQNNLHGCLESTSNALLSIYINNILSHP